MEVCTWYILQNSKIIWKMFVTYFNDLLDTICLTKRQTVKFHVFLSQEFEWHPLSQNPLCGQHKLPPFWSSSYHTFRQHCGLYYKKLYNLMFYSVPLVLKPKINNINGHVFVCLSFLYQWTIRQGRRNRGWRIAPCPFGSNGHVG